MKVNLPSQVVLSLKEFLVLEGCPPEWQALDLYLVRDAETVFYVGQSQSAFRRLWQHLLDGFKGRSALGRFILCNWPAALSFTVEMLSSQAELFAGLGHDRNAAEQELIAKFAPCLNEAMNPHPSRIPERYAPTTQPLRGPRSPSKLIREARYALQFEKRSKRYSPEA